MRSLLVDTNVLISFIEKGDEELGNVLSKYDVDYCILFGSYAKGKATDKSDVDLLIKTNVTGLDFFGLVEDLRVSLHKVVDLLNTDQLKNNLELYLKSFNDSIIKEI